MHINDVKEWIVYEATWKEGETLEVMIPELKTSNSIYWQEKRNDFKFRILCELVKENAVPAKGLYLCCGEMEKIDLNRTSEITNE